MIGRRTEQCPRRAATGAGARTSISPVSGAGRGYDHAVLLAASAFLTYGTGRPPRVLAPGRPVTGHPGAVAVPAVGNQPAATWLPYAHAWLEIAGGSQAQQLRVLSRVTLRTA